MTIREEADLRKKTADAAREAYAISAGLAMFIFLSVLSLVWDIISSITTPLAP